MIYKSFSKRQILAMTWWNRNDLKGYDGIICDGAVRSGKTVCLTDGFFLWSMASFDRESFALCGRSVTSLRRNIIENLGQWLGGIFSVKDNRSRNCLTVSWGDRQNTYYLFGGLDESSYKQIQGVTLAGVLLDEVALMPRSFVEQACARCSVRGSKLWFSCNPAGPEHWFYKQWVEKCREKNILYLHFTMEDNPALDEAIRRRYEALYTGAFYRRYILGQWCAAEGLIYDFSRERHVTKDIPTQGRYFISVDYGTQNPFSAGLWCVTPGRAVRIKEYYYDGRKAGRCLTDEQYYDALCALAGDKPVEQVVVDPSAASFIAVLRRRGRFPVRKAKNDVLAGIRLVSSLLAKDVLLFTEQCTDSIREFSLYCWQPEGQDRPLKENDHAMDDIRYFCATVLRRDKSFQERFRDGNEEMADR